MNHRPLGLLALLSVLAGIACASAPINKQATLDLAKADALVATGCYDCLIEARDTYARIAVGKARPLVIERLFETDVLLGLRVKELALDPKPHFDAAKAIVPELPATFPAAMYLDIAAAIPPDPGGGMPKRNVIAAMQVFTVQKFKDDKTALAAGPSATLGQYLIASLDCTVGGTGIIGAQPPGPRAATATPPAPAAAAPTATITELVAFRRANCTRIDRDALRKFITDDPRYVEAGVFLGRVRSTQPGAKEIAEARAWLDAAQPKWPISASVNYALGALNQTVGDCRAAVSFYDKTLQQYGQHEDAHLGRLMCLSYLGQHTPAIEEASGMIQSKINEGEAYYWRAWNKRELNDLPSARADSDRMKQLLFNDRALTLAGEIEHDLDDLPVADKDLTDAVRISHGDNCTAAWYWALVQHKKQAWTPTAEGFSRAMDCYEADAVKTRGYLDDMKRLKDVDEVWRAGQIASFEAVIKEDESQVSASAFNAAVNYARAQNREKALQYCDLAAKDPARAGQVEELRKLIVK